MAQHGQPQFDSTMITPCYCKHLQDNFCEGKRRQRSQKHI